MATLKSDNTKNLLSSPLIQNHPGTGGGDTELKNLKNGEEEHIVIINANNEEGKAEIV